MEWNAREAVRKVKRTQINPIKIEDDSITIGVDNLAECTNAVGELKATLNEQKWFLKNRSWMGWNARKAVNKVKRTGINSKEIEDNWGEIGVDDLEQCRNRIGKWK